MGEKQKENMVEGRRKCTKRVNRGEKYEDRGTIGDGEVGWFVRSGG